MAPVGPLFSPLFTRRAHARVYISRLSLFPSFAPVFTVFVVPVRGAALMGCFFLGLRYCKGVFCIFRETSCDKVLCIATRLTTHGCDYLFNENFSSYIPQYITHRVLGRINNSSAQLSRTKMRASIKRVIYFYSSDELSF